MVRFSDDRRRVMGDMSIAHPSCVIISSYKISSLETISSLKRISSVFYSMSFLSPSLHSDLFKCSLSSLFGMISSLARILVVASSMFETTNVVSASSGSPYLS